MRQIKGSQTSDCDCDYTYAYTAKKNRRYWVVSWELLHITIWEIEILRWPLDFWNISFDTHTLTHTHIYIYGSRYIIIIIIIIFLHRLGRSNCSGIDAWPSFTGASAIPSCPGFVREGVFRRSGVVRSFEVVDPVLFVFESRVLYSRDL